MVNIHSIEKDKNKVIAELKPYEMEAYLKYLINNLYEAFIEHDEEKALANKEAIEEATKIYEAKGYSNANAVESDLRLSIANDVLCETLEAKHEKEVELSKTIVANYYDNEINKLMYSNSILRRLINGYEKEPSEVMLATIKDVAERVESELIGIKPFIEDRRTSNKLLYPDSLEIIEEYYSQYLDLVEKIDSF